MPRKIRVLVGKPGLDGHDRGAKVVAAALRDAGMEVIYTGLHQTPEQIVEAAIQEDVDVVALSVLSGAHMTLFPDVLALMKERGIGDKLLTGGGIIPAEDMAALAHKGVGRLFGPGSSTQDIAVYIREWFQQATGDEPYVAPPLPAPSAVPASSWAPTAAELKHHAATRPTPARRAPVAKAAPKKRTKPAKKTAAKKSSEAKAKLAPKKSTKLAKKKSAPRKAAPKRTARKSVPKKKAARRGR